MYPMQSSCDQRFVVASYDQTSLNHWKPFVPPKLSCLSSKHRSTAFGLFGTAPAWHRTPVPPDL